MTKAWRVFFLGTLSFLTTLMTFLPAASWATNSVPEFTNMDQIAKDLKVSLFKGKKFGRRIKVAVLDTGFIGFENEIGKRLPESTIYHEGAPSEADNVPVDKRTYHGLAMAEIITELINRSGVEADYELHLFYASGITKLTDAIETVVKDNFDLVLYAQVYEFGGNGDGAGFINALVDKAVKAGVVWINAAGDFGRLTKVTSIDGKPESTAEGSTEWVTFKNKGKIEDGMKIICRMPPGQTCNMSMTLTWNDFKNDTKTGTDKDLDLFLLDSSNKVLASSEKRQKINPDENDATASRLPREMIETKANPKPEEKYTLKPLKAGTYKAKVKITSKNFSASQDKLRITVSGIGIEVVDPNVDETLLPPADNPGVIVVGASDDLGSSRSKALNLPSLHYKSHVILKGGGMIFSTSTASAMAAGLAALYIGTGTNKNRDDVQNKLKSVSRKQDQDVALIAGQDGSPGINLGASDPKAGPGRGPAPVARRRSSSSRRIYLPPQRPPPYPNDSQESYGSYGGYGDGYGGGGYGQDYGGGGPGYDMGYGGGPAPMPAAPMPPPPVLPMPNDPYMGGCPGCGGY